MIEDQTDPDLLHARRLWLNIIGCTYGGGFETVVMAGERDDTPAIRGVLAGIKAGRALQAEEAKA